MSKPLEIIYNSSLSSGIVPHQFKLASVIPVFKKGSQITLTNYRPFNFINKHNILYNKQFGFRHLDSTLHATLPV